MELIYILFVAFIGGFILNLMPCVLPVLSIKVLSIIKAKENSANSARKHFFFISLGIIFSFILIALFLVSLKSMGKYAGFGVNFQEPLFIIGIALALTIFACIIRDSICIDIPSNMKSFFIRHSDTSKALGSFLSGAFATLIATPCTAPFVGTAVGFALSLSILESILIFMFMGIGMAIPFIIFAMFPKFIRYIPKSGSWMGTFKKILEILIYLTIVWLIWVLSKQINFVPSAMVFFLCLLLKFWLEQSNTLFQIKQRKESEKMPIQLDKFKNENSNISAITKTIVTVVIICITLFIPTRTAYLFEKNEKMIESHWIQFDQSKIETYINSGKFVLVDVTAEWCLACKYNKMILDNPFFIKFAQQNNVILMKADYTERSQDIDRFLMNNKRYGIPLTMVFSKKHPSGIVLPSLLKYSDVIDVVVNYREASSE